MESNDKSRMDMRKNRRNEEEARLRRQSRIRAVSLIAIVGVCAGVLGGRHLDRYLDKNGTYLTVGDHKIKKAEFDYYYSNSYSNFINSYGSYASYFGLDTSAPLDQQNYSENLTWKDYFEQQAADNIRQVYALADTGRAEGFEHDAQKEVKKLISDIKSTAKENDQDPEELVKSLYGEDATLDRVEEYMTLSEYASAYYEKVDKEKTVSEEEIKTHYDTNKEDFDSVDYLLCDIEADIPEETEEAVIEEETGDDIILEEDETDGEIVLDEDETAGEEDQTESVSETETETMSESESEALEKKKEEERAKAMAEAKAKAEAMLAAVTDQASFEELYGQYASETALEALHSGERSDSVSSEDVRKWLFEDGRKAGDKTLIEDDENNTYSVVMFLNRFLDETKTVDFRHILIEPETAAQTEEELAAEEESETDLTQESETETETVSESESAAESQAQAEAADKEASQKAEEIYQTWKKGKATEKSFSKLANKHSMDTGSNTDGGLYEKTAKGSMVSEVDSWLFDDSRKAGDTGIVKSTYGYHIMYYVGDNSPQWYNEVEETLHDEKMEAFMDEIEEKYPVKEGRKKLAYLSIPETEDESGTEETSADTESAADESAPASETSADASETEK